jgi:hypothetical protein
MYIISKSELLETLSLRKKELVEEVFELREKLAQQEELILKLESRNIEAEQKLLDIYSVAYSGE